MAGAWDSLLQVTEWNPGKVGMIVAPSYPMLATSTKRTFLEILPSELLVSHNKTENHIVLKNGSEIYFRSADEPDRLRGPNLAWTWLDEGQEAPGGIGGIWDVLLGRLRASTTPSALLTGTPAGMNWVWETFGRIYPLPPGKLLVRAKTRDNFYLPREYVEHLEQTYVGDFARQELEGEFVAFAGLVYRDFRHEVHIAEAPVREWKRVVAGVDFGFTHPTAIIVVAEDHDGRAFVLDEFYEKRKTEAEIVAAAVELQAQYHISEFYCDYEDPRLIQSLQGHVEAFDAVKNVLPGIQAVTARLQVQDDGRPRLQVDPKCVNLIRELQTYRYANRKEGQVAKDAPVKADDDAADALRYAVMGLDDAGFFAFVP